MTSNQYIHEILEYGKLLHQKNYIASCDGNISCQSAENKNEIHITASGMMKWRLQPENILTVDKLKPLTPSSGPNQPSSELSMHLQVYNKQPLAKAVIHAHPPTSIAFSVAYPEEKFFPLDYISELRLALGQVPIISYQRPGTDAMGEALTPFLQSSKLMILARHGVISWGESLEEAYRGIERLEHACEVFKSAKAMGTVSFLPKKEVEVLKSMREKIGFKTL